MVPIIAFEDSNMSDEDGVLPRFRCIVSTLIVDNNPIEREHAAALCRELGIVTVHVASNACEALSLLAALNPPPDFLILDLEMLPTMDGTQLLEQLQKHSITMPVIVVSARDRALIDFVGEMAGVLGLDVIGVLQKPLTVGVLRQSLRRFGATAE